MKNPFVKLVKRTTSHSDRSNGSDVSSHCYSPSELQEELMDLHSIQRTELNTVPRSKSYTIGSFPTTHTRIHTNESPYSTFISGDTAFFHVEERCKSHGECSVSQVLSHIQLQQGVHHMQLNIITYMGRPLRQQDFCYAMAIQWYRIVDQDEHQLISEATKEWYACTADDIGVRFIAKVMVQDEDVLKTILLETTPIKEDPEVKIKVEMYLERKSVLFMGLQSLSVIDRQGEYSSSVEIQETWTLVMDDKRIRLSCESSLLPPIEYYYSNDMEITIVSETPNEFQMAFHERNAFIHLRVASPSVRDAIVLTLRAFCHAAVHYKEERRSSNSLSSQPENEAEVQQISDTRAIYNLPWNRLSSYVSNRLSDDLSDGCELDEIRMDTKFTSDDKFIKNNMEEQYDAQQVDKDCLQLMSDVDSLIENTSRKYTSNPIDSSPIRSIHVRDLLEVEILDDGNAHDGEEEDIKESLQTLDLSNSTSTLDMESLKLQYITMFKRLHYELRELKKQEALLRSERDVKEQENVSLRSDIAVLQEALSSMQIAKKVSEMVTQDLNQLTNVREPKPQNFY